MDRLAANKLEQVLAAAHLDWGYQRLDAKQLRNRLSRDD